MDTFDLRWPQTSATLCTNGWRCRIVWRGKRGNMGGTIENNDLCKQRVAESLAGAPGLLDELRAAGYMDLADEIQTLAPLAVPESSIRPAPTPGEMIASWVEALSGPTEWEACKDRRARSWLAVGHAEVLLDGAVWREDVLLKAPTAKASKEWVLKCVWPAAPKGHARAAPRYYSAQSFHGICACLAAHDEYRSIAFVDEFLSSVGALAEQYPEVAAAVDGWAMQRATQDKPQALH